ncbi:MAG: ArnT family glycosyltransferase, partial [Candidatus Zixiibacteriota bacterium]
MAVNKILNKLSHYHSWLVPIFILMAAIIIRVIYLNQIEVMATFDAPTMDEKYHLELVQSINSDEGLPKEPFFRAPLYPLFLASLFKITNDSFYQVRLIQLIIGSFLPLLMFLLGIKLFNRKIAFWLAVIAVFYPTFIYYDVSLLITFLIVLLSVLLVWQLYRCDGKSYVQFIIVGILLGIAGLARPNILLLGPVLFIWIWIIIKPLVGWKRSLIGYALIGITSFLIILPVSIRNYVVSGDFVLIAWQGGYNFFIGNNHRANGWSATVPGIDRSWKAGYIQSIATAEKQAGKKLKHSEVSDFWY